MIKKKHSNKSSNRVFFNYIPKNRRYTTKKHYIQSVFVPMDRYLDNANRYYQSNHSKNHDLKDKEYNIKTISYLILTLSLIFLFLTLVYITR